jgi:hypothetical protein
MRSPSGPSGQSPPLVTTSTPSPAKAAIASRNHRPRRPVNAHHHTYPMDDKKPIAIRACAARQMTTAGVITGLDPAARLLRTRQPYPALASSNGRSVIGSSRPALAASRLRGDSRLSLSARWRTPTGAGRVGVMSRNQGLVARVTADWSQMSGATRPIPVTRGVFGVLRARRVASGETPVRRARCPGRMVSGGRRRTRRFAGARPSLRARGSPLLIP